MLLANTGILVASKSHSNRIKDVLGGQPRLPMLEEKRWGVCRTIDYSELDNGSSVLTRKVEMQAGSHTSYHLHYLKEEVWTILTGSGQFMLEDQIFTVRPGDVMRFPPGPRAWGEGGQRPDVHAGRDWTCAG